MKTLHRIWHLLAYHFTTANHPFDEMEERIVSHGAHGEEVLCDWCGFILRGRRSAIRENMKVLSDLAPTSHDHTITNWANGTVTAADFNRAILSTPFHSYTQPSSHEPPPQP